jgi:hypothetical protein
VGTRIACRHRSESFGKDEHNETQEHLMEKDE